MSKVYLSSLVKTLQKSVNEVSNLNQEIFEILLDKFFESDYDGNIKPKSVRLCINDNHHINVPLITLSNPQSLFLDEVNMAFSLKFEDLDYNDFSLAGELNKDPQISISLNPKNTLMNISKRDFVDVSLKFKASEHSEALNKIIDEYTNSMVS